MEPLTDDPKPDEKTCQQVATVAGKMAARHGLGGGPYQQATGVNSPEEALVVLAECLRLLGPEPENLQPARDGLLRVREAARRANVSESTIRQACQRGLLCHSRFGSGRGTYRIKPEDLDQYVRDQQVVGVNRQLRHL